MLLESALQYHLYAIRQVGRLYFTCSHCAFRKTQLKLASLIFNFKLILLVKNGLIACILLKIFFLKGAHSLDLQALYDASYAVSSPVFAYLRYRDYSRHIEPA